MGLKRYRLTQDGREALVLLSDDDAKAYGDAAVPVERPDATPTPPPAPGTARRSGKGRTPDNKNRS